MCYFYADHKVLLLMVNYVTHNNVRILEASEVMHFL